MWTEIRSQGALQAALQLAKGSYQASILHGWESLSGSTLKGRAKKYGARYQASIRSLLRRMTEAGIPHAERRGDHGRRVLVIG